MHPALATILSRINLLLFLSFTQDFLTIRRLKMITRCIILRNYLISKHHYESASCWYLIYILLRYLRMTLKPCQCPLTQGEDRSRFPNITPSLRCVPYGAAPSGCFSLNSPPPTPNLCFWLRSLAILTASTVFTLSLCVAPPTNLPLSLLWESLVIAIGHNPAPAHLCEHGILYVRRTYRAL